MRKAIAAESEIAGFSSITGAICDTFMDSMNALKPNGLPTVGLSNISAIIS